MNDTLLPDKPSDLLGLALDDLAKVERSRYYKVKMSSWHTPNEEDGKCHVCLAGAVMAKTLKVASRLTVNPDDYDSGVQSKLQALDLFRNGYVRAGLERLGLWDQKAEKYVRIPHYEDSPKEFVAAMRKLEESFRAQGC